MSHVSIVSHQGMDGKAANGIGFGWMGRMDKMGLVDPWINRWMDW